MEVLSRFHRVVTSHTLSNRPKRPWARRATSCFPQGVWEQPRRESEHGPTGPLIPDPRLGTIIESDVGVLSALDERRPLRAERNPIQGR